MLIIITLSVIMLSFIMLSVIMLSVIMLSVIMLSVIMLNVTMESDVAPEIEHNIFVIGPNSARPTARPLSSHSPATARPQPKSRPHPEANMIKNLLRMLTPTKRLRMTLVKVVKRCNNKDIRFIETIFKAKTSTI